MKLISKLKSCFGKRYVKPPAKDAYTIDELLFGLSRCTRTGLSYAAVHLLLQWEVFGEVYRVFRPSLYSDYRELEYNLTVDGKPLSVSLGKPIKEVYIKGLLHYLMKKDTPEADFGAADLKLPVYLTCSQKEEIRLTKNLIEGGFRPQCITFSRKPISSGEALGISIDFNGSTTCSFEALKSHYKYARLLLDD